MLNGRLIFEIGLLVSVGFLGLGLYMHFLAKSYEELYDKVTEDEMKGKFLREGRSLRIYSIALFILSAVIIVVFSFIPIGWFRSWRQKKREELNKRLRRRQIRVVSYDPPDVEYIPDDDNSENQQRF